MRHKYRTSRCEIAIGHILLEQSFEKSSLEATGIVLSYQLCCTIHVRLMTPMSRTRQSAPTIRRVPAAMRFSLA